MRKSGRSPFLLFVLVLFACLFVFEPPAAHAYIGPGAGFAFVSSFFAVLAAFGARHTVVIVDLRHLPAACLGDLL